MRKLLLLLLLAAMSNLGRAQAGYILYVTSAPSGTCSAGSYQRVVIGPGTVYTCQGGTWTVVGGGAPTGSAGGSLTGTYPNPTIATIPSGATASTQAAGDSSTKVATTSFVASALAGVNPAVAVQAATTAAGNTSGFTYNNGIAGIGATFTGTANTAITIDGYTFTAVGQRLLVKNDTQSPSGAFNGVYYVTTLQALGIAPILTRALDYDMPSDMNNTGAIPVINGTVNGSTQWVQSSQVTTVGTDPVTFTQFSTKQLTGCTNTQSVSGMNCLEEHTASSSATLDFTTCITSTYDEYAIEFLSLIPATNAVSALFRVSTNGGSSYDTGANYPWSGFRVSRTGSAATGADADTKVDLTVSDTVINTSTAGGVSGSMRFFQPGNGATSPRFTAFMGYNNGGAPVQQISGSITGVYTPVTAVNAFRFLFSSGNIASGTIRCYGITQ